MWWCPPLKFSEAKAMAEKAQADAMAMVQSKCVLQWMLQQTTCELYMSEIHIKWAKQYCSSPWNVQNKSSPAIAMNQQGKHRGRYIWICLEIFGNIWIYLDIFGYIWILMEGEFGGKASASEEVTLFWTKLLENLLLGGGRDHSSVSPGAVMSGPWFWQKYPSLSNLNCG